MAAPRALVLSGYGLNCEDESKFALDKAGAVADIVHINDLIGREYLLSDYQIFMLPGGFSYGDDTGSGNAMAQKIKLGGLWDDLLEFVQLDKLIIAVCNGFQVLVNLGLVPAFDGKYGERKVALEPNDTARYIDRWVDLKFTGNSPWVQGIDEIMLPIAHGEGRFYAEPDVLARMNEQGQIAARYVHGEICEHQRLEANPNGALEDIAAATNERGNVLGMMPHPERAIAFTHLPHWTYLKEQYRREGRELPKEGPGLQIIRNGVRYFN